MEKFGVSAQAPKTTVYCKCGTEDCPATKRVKWNTVIFARNHLETCPTLNARGYQKTSRWDD